MPEDRNSFAWAGCGHQYHLECAWTLAQSGGIAPAACALCRRLLPVEAREHLQQQGRLVALRSSPAPPIPARDPVPPAPAVVLSCRRITPPPDCLEYGDRRMAWSARQRWRRNALGHVELQRHPATGVLQGVAEGWHMGWTCHECHREVDADAVLPPMAPPSTGLCDWGCGRLVWQLDLQCGRGEWVCASGGCPAPAAAVVAPHAPAVVLPSGVSHAGAARQSAFSASGPLCGPEGAYGWGNGPLSLPGQGTQSWLYCPLISLGLLELERARGLAPWSIGGRAEVPPLQRCFWLELPESVAVPGVHGAVCLPAGRRRGHGHLG